MCEAFFHKHTYTLCAGLPLCTQKKKKWSIEIENGMRAHWRNRKRKWKQKCMCVYARAYSPDVHLRLHIYAVLNYVCLCGGWKRNAWKCRMKKSNSTQHTINEIWSERKQIQCFDRSHSNVLQWSVKHQTNFNNGTPGAFPIASKQFWFEMIGVCAHIIDEKSLTARARAYTAGSKTENNILMEILMKKRVKNSNQNIHECLLGGWSRQQTLI